MPRRSHFYCNSFVKLCVAEKKNKKVSALQITKSLKNNVYNVSFCSVSLFSFALKRVTNERR